MEDRERLLRRAALEPASGGANCRPRYKEHLPSKCFTKCKNRLRLPASLSSRRWVFLRKGLDDFRRGCPPCEALLAQGPGEGFLPLMYHRAPPPAPKSRRSQPPQDAALRSRLSPAQRARRAFVDAVEARLAPHPLAPYRDLEDAVPAELLLKVLEVLDPHRKLEDTWAYCQDITKRTKEPAKLLKKSSTEDYLGPLSPRKTPVSHPGQWLYEEKKPSETDLLHGPLLHENVRKGVSDFCNWVTTFGSLNIDEEFILKQFVIDYGSKPSYDVFHPTRLNQVPLGLKCYNVGLNKLQELEFSFHRLDYSGKLQKPQNPYKPKWVKTRYGAWYLNTKLWKKQRADEPLVDPIMLLKAQDESSKKELQEQEDLLEELHGMAAFKNFILSRGYRMPSFLKKMCIGKKCKCECKKTPITQSAENSSIEES
ncbi:protein FAM47E [Dasypus novemcinctus]|uniref:protein FAM47E n=1 Tax=Dasypus novemcinctus TaxID=9361 RepID=UPI000328AC4C|nr:protein FAM47E [Dasypus novemcinctus]